MRQRSLRRVFHFRGSLLGRMQGDREPVSFIFYLFVSLSLDFKLIDVYNKQAFYFLQFDVLYITKLIPMIP